MSGRELVILLLGLAIVAVVLRGLYVALNARRGQIKLAIDKNIPQNVDLEALEMAELPGGGARVVTRSLEEVNRQNSALDKAESKARAINLADDDEEAHIPVLMDAVELSRPPEVKPEPFATQRQSPEWDEPEEFEPEDAAGAQDGAGLEETPADIGEVEEEFPSAIEPTPSIGDDWEKDEASAEGGEQAVADLGEVEDPDSVLFDYDEEGSDIDERNNQIDSMSSVAPDYDDDEAGAGLDEGVESFAEAPDDESYDEDDFVDAQGEDEYVEQTEADEEPESFDADSDVDEFSMTAGERIGGNPPASAEIKQSGLFDDDDVDGVASKPRKGRSLFSMFGRKSGQRQETPEREEQQVAAPTVDGYETAERVQREIEDTVVAEAVEQEAFVEDEVADELDQKRAVTEAHDSDVPQPQHEEFEHSEVLVLNVTAKDGRVFAGDDLLHILIMSGLKFGDMNIFHKRLSKDNQGAVIFSVANMLNPGTFDLNNMDEFTTLGISFFLALPTPINNLDAFEQMLAVAQDIRDTLGGDLKDDHRNGMTAQTIEHYRQRIRDFELRRLKAVAARG